MSIFEFKCSGPGGAGRQQQDVPRTRVEPQRVKMSKSNFDSKVSYTTFVYHIPYHSKINQKFLIYQLHTSKLKTLPLSTLVAEIFDSSLEPR